MRFGVRSTAVEELEKVRANLITSRRIVFTPSVEVKEELQNTSIQITCLDEDGTILKRITSADDGEVEDPEGDNGQGTGDSGQQTGGNGQQTGDNTGDTPGGSDTPGGNGGGGADPDDPENSED